MIRSAPMPRSIEPLDGAVQQLLDDVGVVPGRDDRDVLVGGTRPSTAWQPSGTVSVPAALVRRSRLVSSRRPWWRIVWPIRSRFVRR